MRRTPPFLMAWMAGCPMLLAQATPPEAEAPRSDDRRPSVYAIWDNDGGVFKVGHREDKHYTNGVVFGLSHHPQWADDLASRVPDFGGGFGEGPATAAGYFLGQQMFTPDDIEQTAVIEDDRPYAGYSFIGAYWQRASQNRAQANKPRHDTLDHVQLELGVIGDWSYAGDIQKWVHDRYGGDEPRGWDNQLDNEVTVQTYLRRKWRLPLNPVELGDTSRIDVEFIPHVGVALGTVHRNVEAAGTIRAGFNLPNDFGPARISDLPAATGAASRGWSFYGFGQLLGRAVEYNHFLEGSDFQDEIHTVEEEPFVGEATVGVAIGYRGDTWEAAVRYSQTFLTEAFEAQSGRDDYATLGISLGARF